MNAQYHYREAERLLEPSRPRYYNGGQTVLDEQPTPEEVARAQVHATLALAWAAMFPAEG